MKEFVWGETGDFQDLGCLFALLPGRRRIIDWFYPINPEFFLKKYLEKVKKST
jgi:hypothetical protein